MLRKRILVVEDEKDLLKSVTLTLRRAGYDAVPVDNGADAFAEIVAAHGMKEQFNLVITDHHLPVISGIELIDRVNAGGITPPFGMITAFGTRELYTQLEKRGSLFCLNKPFSIQELVDCVATALKAEAAKGRMGKNELPKTGFPVDKDHSTT